MKKFMSFDDFDFKEAKELRVNQEAFYNYMDKVIMESEINEIKAIESAKEIWIL